MKNGLILSFEFPPDPGGIGTYAYQLVLNLHGLGLPVAALVAPGSSPDADSVFDRDSPVGIRRFRRRGLYPLKVAGRLWELLHFCRRHRIQWIYVCSPRAVYIAWVCRLLLGVPYFVAGSPSQAAR